MNLLWILLSTISIGLISFIGIVFVISKIPINKLTFYFVSLASGSMLGTAFMHLIPEATELKPDGAFVLIAVGVLIFFTLEKFLVWRHCHFHHTPADHKRPITAHMIIIGDAIHNLIDGIIIASSYMISPAVGFSVTIAILLHEIPQEIGDFGTLVHSGYPMKKAIYLNAITGTSAVVGALLAYFFLGSMPVLQAYLIPLTAGGFLYIALADLIPQLHEPVALRHTIGQIALLALGFLIVMAFKHHPV